MQLQTAAEYRGATALLDRLKVGYHTYFMAEEKPIKRVLRPLPIQVTEEKIKRDLLA